MVEAEVLEVIPHGSGNARMKLAAERPGWAATFYPPSIRFDIVVRRIGWSRRTPLRSPGRKVHLTMTIWVTVLT
jgi:hypothetical protein